MDGLEVPYAFSSCHVQCDHACAEEVITGPESPKIVDGWWVRWYVDNPTFTICRHRRPGRNIPSVLPRVVFPGVMTEFAGTGDNMELPPEVSTASIVRQNVAGDVLDSRLVVALFS